MENPAYLDSDQSVYESVQCPPPCYSSPTSSTLVIMSSQRRPHHLPAIHRAHPTIHGIAASSHGIPATAHLHGGRVVGVTGVPGNLSSPQGMPPNSGLYPDPALPPMYPVHHIGSVASPSSSSSSSSQPLYSCQAPRGHEHVYQCPGHRAGENSDHRDHRDHRGDHGNYHENIDHLDPRERHLEQIDQMEGLDQRPDYHYGGSDYSSTEPIYAQPHLHPHDAPQTAQLSYTNPRASLRVSSSASSATLGAKHHGTPARFLVRTDSTGASTSSSTLPTVSALLSTDLTHPGHTHTHVHAHDIGKGGAGGSVSSTPAKLKRQGVLKAWKLKFLRGEAGSRRACCLIVGLLALLVLILGALAAVLYLTCKY